MGTNRVRKVGVGAGETVGRIGQVLHSGLLQDQEHGRPMGAETSVHNELAEVGGFFKVTEGGGVGKEILG